MPDEESALMVVGGALLGLMQMLDADPSLDDAQVSETFTITSSCVLDLDVAEAARIVGLELPEVPPII